MNTIVNVGGQNYSIGALPALAQFHVLRRVAPILAAMGVGVAELAGSKKSLSEDDMVTVLSGAADVMSRMPDDEVEYVLFTCLGVVKREQPDGRFMPVVTGRRNFQFADIGMDTMLRLTVEVLRENLAGFFPMPPAANSTSSGSPTRSDPA